MGQKVNPHGLRVGVINGWDTQWYADKKNFGKFLAEGVPSEIQNNKDVVEAYLGKEESTAC